MTHPRDSALDLNESTPADSGGDAVAVRRSAMDLLARREHTVIELERKLRRRYPQTLIPAVLSDLAAEGLQSDARFAENYVRQRAGRGYGPLRIRRELQERGVKESLAASTMAASEIDWQEVAARSLAKKFGTLSQPLSLADQARVLRFMAYRGFSRDHLPSVLD